MAKATKRNGAGQRSPNGTGALNELDAGLEALDEQQKVAFELLCKAAGQFASHAEAHASSLSHVAGLAVDSILQHVAGHDVRALCRMAGYKRSDELGSIAYRCDEILDAWVRVGDRPTGVAKALRFALAKLDPVICGVPVPPLPRDASGQVDLKTVTGALPEEFATAAGEILDRAPSQRCVNGHSVVRKALMLLGVRPAGATNMLKFLERGAWKPKNSWRLRWLLSCLDASPYLPKEKIPKSSLPH